MKILPVDIARIKEMLSNALKEDYLSFSYPTTMPSIKKGNLSFIEELRGACVTENPPQLVLPIEGTLEFIRNQNEKAIIDLDVKAIQEIQDRLNFTVTAELLTADMKEINWNKIDVDNPGERVAGLIKDLRAVSADSKEGFELIGQLIKEHWMGTADEKGLFELFNKENKQYMNEKNLDYLKSNVRNHGFGETLGPELEEKMKSGATEFTLAHKTEVNKHEMEATLYFKKSDTTEMYFFNKYDTRLKSEKGETMAQTFYINNGWGVTLKEAYNLLNGRAVHKELTNKEDQKYKAWIQLDFSTKDKNGNYERKQFHQNYGYDLKETLSFYPIKEMMKESDAKDLVRSLERGNVQMVTLETPGKDIRVFIEANPQYKSINVYDNKMTRLGQDRREEIMKKPEMNEGKEKGKEQSKEKDQKQELTGEGKDGKKQGRGKKDEKANGQDNGLVQKKRTSGKKGLGV